jgi:hypothetical protein
MHVGSARRKCLFTCSQEGEPTPKSHLVWVLHKNNKLEKLVLHQTVKDYAESNNIEIAFPEKKAEEAGDIECGFC